MRVHPDLVARLSGWLAVLCFAAISAVGRGFFVVFKPPFTRISEGEANLWLALAFLLTPGGALLGYGYRAPIGRLLVSMQARAAALTNVEKRALLVFLGVMSAVIARLSNALILSGYPVTDDEWAARFGGQALAQGRVLVEVPFSLDAFPPLFMYVRGHSITSMDWLGTQLAWCLAELTHSGNWLFAVSAALPVPCIAYVLSKRLSVAWGALGALVALTSPMAFVLSMTTHGHLHSRALIALSLALHVSNLERSSRLRGALLGASVGLAMLCRPFESAMLLGPLAALEGHAALRGGGARRAAFLAALAALLVAGLVFVAHSYAVTGSWVPARFSEGAYATVTIHPSWWERFGSNVAFNALRLGVWFAGPLGVLLVVLGAPRDRLNAALALGVLAALLLGLAHVNYGIHSVGPIHHSECVVPLTILAVSGLAHSLDRLRALRLPTGGWTAAALSTWLLVQVGFDVAQSVALFAQAEPQRSLYASLEDGIPARERPAVVLAAQFFVVWSAYPQYAERGTWVFEWRRPEPDFGDEILILRDTPDALASVRRRFPGRPVYRLHDPRAGRQPGLEHLP